MTTRIHTSITLFGLSCEVAIEADSAQAARGELEALQGGTTSPNTQAASQPAPAATQTAAATPPAAATAPAPAATATATPTATQASAPAPTPTTAAAAPTSGEDLLTKATELLGREGGEAYLKWALEQVGASTVGTTPADKHPALLQHIKTGLGEA